MIHRTQGATRHPRRCNGTNGSGKEEEEEEEELISVQQLQLFYDHSRQCHKCLILLFFIHRRRRYEYIFPSALVCVRSAEELHMLLVMVLDKNM
jgi:hypothetical protein